jgi:hypothetical protein
VFIEEVICLTIFSGNLSRQKSFKFTEPICPCSPSNFWRHILQVTILWILHSKSWGFGFKAQRLRDKCHQRLIFQVYRKIRTEDSRLDNYSGHEHLTVSTQLRKYSEDTFKMKFERTRRHLQKYSDACSTRLRRAQGLVRPGYMGLYTWHTSPRNGMGYGPCPTSVVTTRSAVGLLLQ